MAAVAKGVGNRLVLSPQEPIVGGGAAEAFERDLQKLFRRGYRELIVDLSGVPVIDSAGVRALVRGHTSAQRVAGSLRVAGLKPAVRHVLELSRLGDVLELYDTVEAARLVAVADDPGLAVGSRGVGRAGRHRPEMARRAVARFRRARDVSARRGAPRDPGSPGPAVHRAPEAARGGGNRPAGDVHPPAL